MTYEYKSITIQGNPDETLNKMAAEGWEFVTVDHNTYLFKRNKLAAYTAWPSNHPDSYE